MVNDRAMAALSKLEALPGMKSVKDQVEQMVQFALISKERKRQGLKVVTQSSHMIFSGNPGTGKTTAARLIGEAFAAMGLLKTNVADPPFVEIHHADITHPHVGQAEITIKAKFKEARGGVLFIDEAYAFVSGETSHKSGDKVIAAIVQLMEDMRDEIVVIAAGYPDNMGEFLAENPGLRSRFPVTINFPDYDIPDLIRVAAAMCAERDYEMTRTYAEKLARRLGVEKLNPGFGNARTVRNLIEQSIRLQSVRITRLTHKSRSDMVSLTEHDLPEPVKQRTEKAVLLQQFDAIRKRLLEIERDEIIYEKFQ